MSQQNYVDFLEGLITSKPDLRKINFIPILTECLDIEQRLNNSSPKDNFGKKLRGGMSGRISGIVGKFAETYVNAWLADVSPRDESSKIYGSHYRGLSSFSSGFIIIDPRSKKRFEIDNHLVFDEMYSFVEVKSYEVPSCRVFNLSDLQNRVLGKKSGPTFLFMPKSSSEIFLSPSRISGQPIIELNLGFNRHDIMDYLNSKLDVSFLKN